MTLKELRMWHWKAAKYAERRCDELVARSQLNYADDRKRASVFHLGCVEALNTVVPGSVEQDVINAITERGNAEVRKLFKGIQESKAFSLDAAHKAFERCPIHQCGDKSTWVACDGSELCLRKWK